MVNRQVLTEVTRVTLYIVVIVGIKTGTYTVQAKRSRCHTLVVIRTGYTISNLWKRLVEIYNKYSVSINIG